MDNFGNNYMQQPPQFGYTGAAAIENELTMSAYVGKIMRRVFGKMTLGILVTALVSLFIVSNSALLSIFFSSQWVFYGLVIAELAVVIMLSARLNKMRAGTASLLFYLYATLTGITFAPIFLVFSGAAIVKTFFITSATFGAMAAYGYITKKDLSRMGSILVMCLIGLIVVTIVNIFLNSTMLDWVISFVGVAIFIGLTAWDTQKIKRMAAETVGDENVSKVATIGALSLYLDFVNLFLYLLRIFGGNRS